MRNNYFQWLCLLIYSLGVWGCATSPPGTYLTVKSDPPGAMYYSEGKNQGYTPVQLYYDTTDQRFDEEDGRHHRVEGGEVRWVRGATQSVPVIYIDKQLSHYQEITFRRPDVPGLDQDLLFALKVAQIKLETERNSRINTSGSASGVYTPIPLRGVLIPVGDSLMFNTATGEAMPIIRNDPIPPRRWLRPLHAPR